MESKEIEQLIAFHQAGLAQYRQYMSPSAQQLEERTIHGLDILLRIEEAKHITENRTYKGHGHKLPE